MESDDDSWTDPDTKGDERKFGYFRCDKCDRSWESGKSWEGYAQECLKCGKKVFPYSQCELQSPGSSNGFDYKPPHPEDKCGKCIELGTNCRNHYSKNN